MKQFIFLTVFFINTLSSIISMDNRYIEITEKMDGITLELTYIKPEGIVEIPFLPRSSIKIDKLVVNGNERIWGIKPLLWFGADEEYGKLNSVKTTAAESVQTLEMYWSLVKKNGKTVLEYSSLIDKKPTLYEIPENVKSVTITYQIRYPDKTFSPKYTEKFEFIWDIKDLIRKSREIVKCCG